MHPLVRALPAALLAAIPGCDLITGPSRQDTTPLTELPRSLTGSERTVIGGSNQFAFQLLREVAERDSSPNLFLSPLSASMALGMTMNGARGETFAEMRSALGFGTLQPAEINSSYRSLIDLLRGLDRNVEMRIANSIWSREDLPLLESFVSSSRTHFDAEVSRVPFDATTLRAINAWVDRNTNGKIDRILDEIPPGAVMYLINAIYFNGNWTKRFERARTHDAPFRLEDGSTTTVRMMHQRDVGMLAAHTADAVIADIPYGRQAFSMTVVVPREGSSVRELVDGLDRDAWDAWMAALRPATYDLYLPRFRLEYERELNEMLQAMGMDAPFDPWRADFSGIAPDGGIYVSKVKQKTFVNVDEEGTEAAAVTSVEMRVVSLPPSMNVDRPFLVAIRERLSGTILFLGVIGDPTAS
jgi:serine protease inhibitor